MLKGKCLGLTGTVKSCFLPKTTRPCKYGKNKKTPPDHEMESVRENVVEMIPLVKGGP